MSESGNIFRNRSPMPSFELKEWYLVARSKHHSTSVLNVAVVIVHSVWCLTSVTHLLTMLLGLLLAVVCIRRAVEVEGKEVEVEVVDAAVAQNIDMGSCSLRPRILAWWLFDFICDLTPFTATQVILIVFLQTWQKASLLLPTTGPSQSLNLESSSQRSENLHFPMF